MDRTNFVVVIFCKSSLVILFLSFGHGLSSENGNSESQQLVKQTAEETERFKYLNSLVVKPDTIEDWEKRRKELIESRQRHVMGDSYNSRKLEVLENQRKHSSSSRGWTSSDTAIVVGIFAFCFGVALIRYCCCADKSRATRTVQNPTFIFAGVGTRDAVQHHEIASMLASTRRSSLSVAAAVPPPRYCEREEDPPPDYYTAIATNALLSPNAQSINR